MEKQTKNNVCNVMDTVSPIVKKAIENAKFHGINLYPGTKNPGLGDCVFESVLDNLNTRNCFHENLIEDALFWRNVWMTEIEKIAYDNWNEGRTIEEWKSAFNFLKQPGVYEVSLGDLVPPGIAHCIKKNLLIFNTSPEAFCPVYVVPASMFGGSPDTDVPICLAYNQSHYESLIPCSHEDIEKTVSLSKQVTLNFFYQRIFKPFF